VDLESTRFTRTPCVGTPPRDPGEATIVGTLGCHNSEASPLCGPSLRRERSCESRGAGHDLDMGSIRVPSIAHLTGYGLPC
jgi:hypothetical protein